MVISVATSQETIIVPIKKTNCLMLFKEIIAVYSEDIKPTNSHRGQNADISNVKAGT